MKNLNLLEESNLKFQELSNQLDEYYLVNITNESDEVKLNKLKTDYKKFNERRKVFDTLMESAMGDETKVIFGNTINKMLNEQVQKLTPEESQLAK